MTKKHKFQAMKFIEKSLNLERKTKFKNEKLFDTTVAKQTHHV